jgi:hypothetical protein
MQLDASAEETMSEGENSEHAPEWSPRVVYMHATVSGLASPCIPFVVLKHDPLARLVFDLETRCLSYSQEQTLEAVRESWDAPANELPREQRYFLMAWSAYPMASSLTVAISGLTFGIASPGPLYKRWIMTSAVERQGELVAWCEEIDMRGLQEEIIEVHFNEENMIRLLPGEDVERTSKVA